MPKNRRCTSARRKPLADVSNGRKASRSPKKGAPEEDGVGGPRDRRLLARADLLKLVKQIDELVMQALEHRLTNETERQEIECFIQTLSDMRSSLKSWVPRLKQVFGSSAIRTDKQFGRDLSDKSSFTVDGESITPDGLNEPDQGLIVSPSPLVSWRNGASTSDGGRQLFLLTPLQKSKAAAPKSSVSPKSLLGGLSNRQSSCSGTLGLPTLSNSPSSTCKALVEKTGTVPTPNKFLPSRTRVSGSTSNTGFVSPAKISNCKDNFIYCLTTPRLKTPAAKTRFRLDSIPESFPEDSKVIRNATPSITRTQMNNASAVSSGSRSNECSDNSSSDEVSKTLASKYPELFGLHPAAAQRKEVEESLHWFLSPPKTCVLMEPTEEKFLLASGRGKHSLNSGLKTLSLAAPESSTPMWKDFENATENGKKAGEATLKRELWTKFDAVSANGLRFDPSIFQQLSSNRLADMLEDVS